MMKIVPYRVDISQRIKWIDIPNNIFHEQYRKTTRLFGIVIYHKEYDSCHEVDQKKETVVLGFKK